LLAHQNRLAMICQGQRMQKLKLAWRRRAGMAGANYAWLQLRNWIFKIKNENPIV
jgi:type VI protein secretion system component Hcp